MTRIDRFNIVSPVDGSIYATEQHNSPAEVEAAFSASEAAFSTWKTSTLPERVALVTALAEALSARKGQLAEALSWTIGRPIEQADETSRFALVTQKHVEASAVLQEEAYPSEPGIERFVRRNGQGVHLSIAPWNYPVGLLPWLTIAPLLAGNTVILKHAEQTSPIGRLLQEAYDSIGGPKGVLQVLNMSHETAGQVIAAGGAKGINFIGSVRGGLEIQRQAAGTLTHLHLELGGKDPAYVRPDANIADAIPMLVDGCFSNAGQSCCSVERIYVHEAVYSLFVEAFEAEAANWSLGNPITDNPLVGPVVRETSANFIRNQVDEAVAGGALAIVSAAAQAAAATGGCYVAPTILTGVTADMNVMRHETFGPVACIQKVQSDAEAIHHMNDSEFGLTAGVWTQDRKLGLAIADQLDAGTVFVNRCDHADLYLPWGGQKMSGLGRVNGREGLRQLSSTKSFHVRGW